MVLEQIKSNGVDANSYCLIIAPRWSIGSVLAYWVDRVRNKHKADLAIYIVVLSEHCMEINVHTYVL